jgi:hypothetical protein
LFVPRKNSIISKILDKPDSFRIFRGARKTINFKAYDNRMKYKLNSGIMLISPGQYPGRMPGKYWFCWKSWRSWTAWIK